MNRMFKDPHRSFVVLMLGLVLIGWFVTNSESRPSMPSVNVGDRVLVVLDAEPGSEALGTLMLQANTLPAVPFYALPTPRTLHIGGFKGEIYLLSEELKPEHVKMLQQVLNMTTLETPQTVSIKSKLVFTKGELKKNSRHQTNAHVALWLAEGKTARIVSVRGFENLLQWEDN